MKRSRPIVTGLVAVSVLGSMLAAQDTTQTSDEAPRTAWGVPELGGVWDYRTITPLERPEEFKDKAVLTEEEAAAFAEQRNTFNEND